MKRIPKLPSKSGKTINGGQLKWSKKKIKVAKSAILAALFLFASYSHEPRNLSVYWGNLIYGFHKTLYP